MESADQNVDHLIQEQSDKIAKDIAAATHLISDRIPLAQLETDFANDEIFKSKVVKIGERGRELEERVDQGRWGGR